MSGGTYLFQSSFCSIQYGSGLNCSPKSSLILVPNVCLYGDIGHWRKHKLHFPDITTHKLSLYQKAYQTTIPGAA